ncbi:hypothetical protein H2198_006361 [Neophaeococcomyces mojaviensis]|uniref:Uncharacterized protein n=1 Tax=Neophaeococcomyces mojaviensis TaxID=3383035 RepID=A0ACC3A3G6_9EURO|nr:hypothetical protein H2198_006361 [Knufia sp. JES_112]
MHSWIVDHLKTHFDTIQVHLGNDESLRVSALAAAKLKGDVEVSFGLVSSNAAADSLPCVVISIETEDTGDIQTRIRAGAQNEAQFCLSARSEDWQAFFTSNEKLVRPYQSFWGMLRVLGPQHKEVCAIGDTTAFARYARVWRISLDRIRDAVNEVPILQPGTATVMAEHEDTEEDSVVGRYTCINHSEYGKVKIFYEMAGHGPEVLVFLHTAGSDSRQYHSLMNNKTLQEQCTMIAFDLPAHGRSSLGTKQYPESYALTEESYIESIDLFLQKLKMRNVVLCGASMAGHICIAAAIRAQELSVRGVIPCEGCAHLPFSQPIYEIRGNDSSILDPERVCGMIAPTSPEYYKQQIWWQYSSQGAGVFSGDLKFYFKGWDGRGRVENIDTETCPVYMLTGEYDYSCTVEASKETAAMIKGAVFEEMKGLGHFPLTENPTAVLPYLMRAIDHIQAHWHNKKSVANDMG